MPRVRRAAYDAELEAWDTVAVPLAAALNAFKGAANTLNRRRGWEDSLDPALFTNNVDRETLDAMQEAVVASLPDFAGTAGQGRRARPHRRAALVGSASRRSATPRAGWRGPRQSNAVADAFGTYSPRLAALVGRADDRGLDRRRAAGRQGRRRVLHAGPGRRESRCC